MDINELAGQSVDEVKSLAEKLSRLKGFSLGSLKGLFLITKDVVKHVEEIGLAKNLSGADKQALAIAILNRVVPMPWYLRPVVNAVLPPLIDAIVDALKDKFGK